ncbi:MAG: hypothetical protein Q8Q02_13600 [Nocardioides sp.]|nr:hypothetical protein [Nocardioides sp.]
MTTLLRTGLPVVLALALLLGCGAGGSDDDTAEPSEAGTATARPEGPPQVDAAVADLAAREGVAESDVRVESIAEVTWPDGSLGCPKPGEMYTQALVEGLEIVLSVAATRYAYHSSLAGEPFLCEQPAGRPGGDQPSDDG